MINTILINHQVQTLQFLEQNLNTYCPHINICGLATSLKEASRLIDQWTPSLAILEMEMPEIDCFRMLESYHFSSIEMICISSSSKDAVDAFKYQIGGFLLKPIQVDELVAATHRALDKIEARKKKLESQKPPGDLIGIPSIEGFDFIPVTDIIRCEGLQNGTRIITKDKSDIVSSYNIGEFKKRFEKYSFFLIHKSHLINLTHIKKYYKEGTILMSDKSFIPVAKRRKKQFLNQMLLGVQQKSSPLNGKSIR